MNAVNIFRLVLSRNSPSSRKNLNNHGLLITEKISFVTIFSFGTVYPYIIILALERSAYKLRTTIYTYIQLMIVWCARVR